jgi:hypothetical protein
LQKVNPLNRQQVNAHIDGDSRDMLT